MEDNWGVDVKGDVVKGLGRKWVGVFVMNDEFGGVW